jgi:hypothetical protein
MARPRPPTPAAYGPCPRCGGSILTGVTQAGQQVALDTHIKTYVVLWAETPLPTLAESRGYAVHRCAGLVTAQ